MKIKLSKLRALINEAATKATEDGPFGAFLFGQTRNLPSPKNKEKDTEKEKELEYDLRDHYNGEMFELNPWIPLLDKLEKQGKYTDILKVPEKYKYAYRTLNVKLPLLTKILGYEPAKYETGEVYEDKIKGTLDTLHTPHQSWTVDFGVFEEIKKDWGSFSPGKNQFLIFLRAPIRGHRNRFLLNPDATGDFAERYAYQKEIISIGSVTCDYVWYISTGTLPYDEIDSVEAKAIGLINKNVKR